MKCNVGSIDRIIRIVIDLGIVIAGMVFKSYLGLMGIAILATGVFGYCGLYLLFKVNTSKKES
jgi:hypothetical protein